MIKPGNYDPSKPDIELFDFKSKRRYGLKLDGQGALQVGTLSQDDTVYVRNVGKRPGDFDEQRSWKSGRGVENLSDDAEGFWDSKDAWTMTPGFAHQTLLWQFAEGIIQQDMFLPNKNRSMEWKELRGSSRFLSNSFVSNGFTAVRINMWIRRIGTPGTLTVQLRSNTAPGVPDTVLASATVTASEVGATLSMLRYFNISSTAVSGGTTYHIVATAEAPDTKNNHWEIGGEANGSLGRMSASGSGWSAASFNPYYRMQAAEPNRKFHSFSIDGAMYIVDERDNGVTASKVYINGDRGKATAGTSSTITDSSKTWAVNRWAGAWVRIHRGAGRGQFREIASNTSTTLTLTGDALEITPTTTSEFYIYATSWFTEVQTTGLGVITGKPLVVNQIAFFPQGQSVNIRTMVWNPTTKVHDFDDNGTNKADLLEMGYDAKNGLQIWRASNANTSGGATTVSRAAVPAWASAPADLVFQPEIQIGDKDYNIVGLNYKDNALQVFKEDGKFTVFQDTPSRFVSGMQTTPDPSNGAASIVHQKFLYYSWLHSFVREYGQEIDDVGQDWKGKGLPEGREGVISSFDSYTNMLFYAVDAGTAGISCVMAFDGLNSHEVLRGYRTGSRIRMVKVQPNIGTRNRLWTGVGGDLMFQELPLMKASPRLDTGCRYQHEGFIHSSKIDMGTASGMPKFIKELSVTVDNLGASGTEVEVEYQVDENVGSTLWVKANKALVSPESTIFLGLNNVRAFAYRLILRTNNNALPTLVRGVTPNGFARTPYKMIWTLRCKADNVSVSGRLAKPTELMRWLLDNARFPSRVEMRSQYEMAHKFFVTIHPPRMFPYKPAVAGQDEESVFTVVLEEM